MIFQRSTNNTFVKFLRFLSVHVTISQIIKKSKHHVNFTLISRFSMQLRGYHSYKYVGNTIAQITNVGGIKDCDKNRGTADPLLTKTGIRKVDFIYTFSLHFHEHYLWSSRVRSNTSRTPTYINIINSWK